MPSFKKGKLPRVPSQTMAVVQERSDPYTEDSSGTCFDDAPSRAGRLLRPFDAMPVMDPVGIAAGIDFSPPLDQRGARAYDQFAADGFPGVSVWWEPPNYWGLTGTAVKVPRVVVVADDKNPFSNYLFNPARSPAVTAALDGLYDDLLVPHRIAMLYTSGQSPAKQYHPLVYGCPHTGWTRAFLNIAPGQASPQVRSDLARSPATGLYAGGEFLCISLLSAAYSFAGALPASGQAHEDHFEEYGGYHGTQRDDSVAVSYATALLTTRLAADQAAAAGAADDWARRGHTYCFTTTVPAFDSPTPGHPSGGPATGLPPTRDAYLDLMAGDLPDQRIGPDWTDSPSAIAALVRAEIERFFDL